ncbi:hypothetical protein B0I35DRAFT_61880 [Stachybotrys elegans]|uniref:Uncharacterized protein n=1 Tax=Stachybotrys elegans TaxID=80388 RepID=A0A8K0WML9_9HYPO|nr:hypothetical protein B0I35DRAFT_61880 [Stachybotrys elegans]
MDEPWTEQLNKALQAISVNMESQNHLIKSQIEQLHAVQSLLERRGAFSTAAPPMRSIDNSGDTDGREAPGQDADVACVDCNENVAERSQRQGRRVFYKDHISNPQGLIPTQGFGPNKIFFAPLDEPQDLSLLQEPPLAGDCNASWRYWRPIRGEDFYKGRGRPDYIPEWELAPKTESGTEWYHVDDPDQKTLSPGPCLDRSEYRVISVPYALAPPQSGERISKASLHALRCEFIESLGQLYAVPPDARVPLRFEKNQLRLAKENDTLEKYLHAVKAFFEALDEAGGFFRITDFDDFMNYDTYEPGTERQYSADSHGFPAGPALKAEQFYLNIPDGRYRLYLEHGFYRDQGSRRWHRVIHLEGLAHLAQAPCVCQEEGEAQMDPSKIWQLLICNKQNGRWENARLREVLDEAFHLHISCSYRQGFHNPYNQHWKPFHVTWYRTFKSIEDRRRTPTLSNIDVEVEQSSWKSGAFFHTGTKFQQSAFTFGLFPTKLFGIFRRVGNLDPVEDEDYWTFLVLTPLHMKPCSADFSSPHTIALHLIQVAFEDAADSWEEIAHHLKEMLADDDDAALDPHKHDRLLFDDSTFSRSRRYFWAADILETFQDSIGNLLKQWEYWWTVWEPRLREFEGSQSNRLRKRETDEDGKPFFHIHRRQESLEEVVPRITSQVHRMEQIKSDLDRLATRTKTLRDGLFNASSVIESRAATDLGQNVKLLTYVSIFYMPVGICAAIWSINADYGLTAFGIVTAAVAIVTYVVVGNLNNTVDGIHALYRAVETWLVNDMIQRSRNAYWESKGKEFSQFRPKRDNVMPSKWYVLWYVIRRNVRLFLKEAAPEYPVPGESSNPVGAEDPAPVARADPGTHSGPNQLSEVRKGLFSRKWKGQRHQEKGKDVESQPVDPPRVAGISAGI